MPHEKIMKLLKVFKKLEPRVSHSEAKKKSISASESIQANKQMGQEKKSINMAWREDVENGTWQSMKCVDERERKEAVHWCLHAPNDIYHSWPSECSVTAFNHDSRVIRFITITKVERKETFQAMMHRFNCFWCFSFFSSIIRSEMRLLLLPYLCSFGMKNHFLARTTQSRWSQKCIWIKQNYSAQSQWKFISSSH